MIVLYLISNIYLLFMDYKKFNSIISPFFLFSLPYTLIVTIQFILSFFARTYTFDFFILLVIIIFQITFFLVSRFSSRIFNSSHQVNIKSVYITFIGFLFSIYLIIHFVNLASSLDTLGKIVQEPFQVLYSSGFNFYIRIFLIFILFHYVAGLKRMTIGSILVILLFLIPNFLTFVKGIILINIIGVFLIFIYNKIIKFNFFSVIFGIFSMIISFILVVIIEESIWTFSVDYEILEESLSNLLAYFFAGIQSFISNFHSNIIPIEFPNSTIAIFYNPFARLFEIGPIISNVPAIRIILFLNGIPFSSSNVNTYIGTLFLYNGLFIGNLMNVAISLISTFLFKIYLSRKSRFYFSLYLFFATGLSLSWFEYYYLHSFYFYVIVFLGLFPILVSSLLKVFGPVV